MNGQEIRYYLQELATELDLQHIAGEMVIAGGAAMILTIGNRPSTKDIDAYFASGAQKIRQAVAIIARREQLPPDWLNDGVKGFFGTQPPLTL